MKNTCKINIINKNGNFLKNKKDITTTYMKNSKNALLFIRNKNPCLL